jgi:transcriptional regulator NrdR family protein
MSEANGNGEPVGLRCPRCHCGHFMVTKTVPVPGGRIRRYRRCRHCAHRLTTVEMPAGEAARLRPPFQ